MGEPDVNIYMDRHGEDGVSYNIQRMVEAADNDILLMESDQSPYQFEFMVDAWRDYGTLQEFVDSGYLPGEEVAARGYSGEEPVSTLEMRETKELAGNWTDDSIENLGEDDSERLFDPEDPVFGDIEKDKGIISLMGKIIGSHEESLTQRLAYVTSFDDTEMYCIDNNREEDIATAMRETDLLPNNPEIFHNLKSIYGKNSGGTASGKGQFYLAKLSSEGYSPEEGFQEVLHRSGELRNQTMADEIEEHLSAEGVSDAGVVVGNKHAKGIQDILRPEYDVVTYELPENPSDWKINDPPAINGEEEEDSSTILSILGR